jgi:hypothetical protein
MRTRVVALCLGLVLFASWAAFGQQSKSATGKPKPNANGQVGEAAAKAAAALPPAAAAAHACLQLYNGNSVLWSIDAIINPNVYPYPITGGTIKGTICGSPNVTITGGTLGSNLNVMANLPSNCANPVKIIGNATVPVGYQGTYGFFGSSTMFNHHTLFLGYNKTTCP